ncbi:uncharacterized protein KY384_001620 [Bacidia gigantensis]|uniref:uncharacterized protein n=1 Tax=Bacidia gigantensis TaxID=2732470 RepID=UPI001D047FA6|nr:uncharacterized protein KY384_001620 [Bacidia gigantensis]KAG8533879.1 hypothetical protein KY384_001620 [Bacidia gigantensis]
MEVDSADKSYIRELVKRLNAIVDTPGELSESSMNSVLELSKVLMNAADKSVEAGCDPAMALQHNLVACLKIATDLKIFDTLTAQSGKSWTAAQLGKPLNADSQLIVRIMRVMTAAGFAKETGISTYASTPKSEIMTRPQSTRGLSHAFSTNIQISQKSPEFFRRIGYRSTTMSEQTPFQYAYDTEDTYYERMEKKPEIAQNFSGGVRATRGTWLEWFPVQKELLEGARDDPNAVLMVDLGGGRGRDLAAFKAQFPDAPGRFVLEDQQHTLDSTDVQGIEKLSHDFFTAQPVKGARFYHTHYILHNWDDEKSILILKQIASAMTKGYSKVILNEWILPDMGCSLYEGLIDIQMLMAFTGMERTRGQWQSIIEAAGLKLTKFWMPPGYGEGIIEASL